MMRTPLATLLFLSCLTGTATAQIIVIDPGHGGGDPGGTGSGLQEKEIVLDTSRRFRDLLVQDSQDESGGGSWTPHLTRDSDVFVELAARAAYANSLDADRFLSVHANAFGTSSANGTETFSYSDSGTGANLRDMVQEEMIAAWQLTDRGSKVASFSVLRNTAMPAELHELGFVTNPVDATKLADPSARQDAALAHLHALQRHYGLSPHTPAPPVLPPLPPPALPATLDLFVSSKRGPTPSAPVYVDGLLAGQTNSDGFLRLEALTPAKHRVVVKPNGFEVAQVGIEMRSGEIDALHLQLELPPEEDLPELAPEEYPAGEPKPPELVGGCTAGNSSSGLPLALALFGLAALGLRRRRSIPEE